MVDTTLASSNATSLLVVEPTILADRSPLDAQNQTTHVPSVNVPTGSFGSSRVNEASAQINHLRITSSPP